MLVLTTLKGCFKVKTWFKVRVRGEETHHSNKGPHKYTRDCLDT